MSKDTPISLSAAELANSINSVARAAISVEQYALVVSAQASVTDFLNPTPKLQSLFSTAQADFRKAAQYYLNTFDSSVINTLGNAQALANNFNSSANAIKNETGDTLKTLLIMFFNTAMPNTKTYKNNWDIFQSSYITFVSNNTDEYNNLATNVATYMGTEKSPMGAIKSYFDGVISSLTKDLSAIINGIDNNDMGTLKNDFTSTTIPLNPPADGQDQASFNLDVITITAQTIKGFDTQVQDYQKNIKQLSDLSKNLYPQVIQKIYPITTAIAILEQFATFINVVAALGKAADSLQTSWQNIHENFKSVNNELNGSDPRLEAIQTEFVKQSSGWGDLYNAITNLVIAFSN